VGGGLRHKRKLIRGNKHMTVDDAARAIPSLTMARIGRLVQVKRIDAASRVQMKNETVHFLQTMLKCCHMADDEGKNIILMRHVAAKCQEKYPYLMHVFTLNKTYEAPSEETDSDSDDDYHRRSSKHRHSKKSSRHGKRKSKRSKSLKSKHRSSSKKASKPVKKDPVPADNIAEGEKSGAD
jgi:hypothetical protein